MVFQEKATQAEGHRCLRHRQWMQIVQNRKYCFCGRMPDIFAFVWYTLKQRIKKDAWTQKRGITIAAREGITVEKQGMTDIHMHLIPGVDDGAQDESMALMMALRAREQGIGCIFATPHSCAFDADPKQVRGRFAVLKSRLFHYFPDMPLYFGCEVLADSSGMDAVLSALASGRYPTMNETAYVLTEFSQWIQPDAAIFCAEAMAGEGWKPIIAHMERYAYLRQNMELVGRFRELGCLIQVNAYSLTEESDESIGNWARRLVREGAADFLGTDAHRTYHRPPSARSGVAWVYEHCDEAYADALAWGNAQRLLIK